MTDEEIVRLKLAQAWRDENLTPAEVRAFLQAEGKTATEYLAWWGARVGGFENTAAELKPVPDPKKDPAGWASFLKFSTPMPALRPDQDPSTDAMTRALIEDYEESLKK